jgi:predicted DNA binding CopG/RHH family protein
MERSENTELAKRINHAFVLLKKQIPDSQIVNNLAEMFNISKVQAYRYLKQAKKNDQKIPIPESSIVFTVKLPPMLIQRIRAFAAARGMSISKVVRTALEDFLAKKDHGQRKEAG